MAKAKRRMPDGLASLASEAIAEHEARPCSPRILIRKNRSGGWSFESPYPDEDRGNWEALLLQAFGTRHGAVMNHFLNVLTKLVGERQWDEKRQVWMPDEEAFNAVVSIIHSMMPENAAQAAHAAQLAALHLSAMNLGEQASKSWSDARTVAVLAKTVRAYGDGMERLARLQGKTQARQVKQTIEVHYYDNRDQRSVHFAGGVGPFGGQAHGTDGGATIQSPALPSPQSGGEPLRIASGKGQASVPDPRRGSWLGRTMRGAQRLLSARGLDK